MVSTVVIIPLEIADQSLDRPCLRYNEMNKQAGFKSRSGEVFQVVKRILSRFNPVLHIPSCINHTYSKWFIALRFLTLKIVGFFRTALHCAAANNSLEMSKFLVTHGACIFAVTSIEGKTPSQCCEKDSEGFEECFSYLSGNFQEQAFVDKMCPRKFVRKGSSFSSHLVAKRTNWMCF